MGAAEFRLEVVAGDARTALRRYGWLMLLVLLADSGVEIGVRLLADHRAFLGVDWTGEEWAVWGVQRLASALTAAVIYLLVFAGAREEPIQPVAMIRRLASCLPVILIALAVLVLPTALASVVFQGNAVAAGFARLATALYELGLFLTLGLVVPAALDKGLKLSAAIERGVALIKGRRWPLFLLNAAPSIMMGAVQYSITRFNPEGQLVEIWPLYSLNYVIHGFALLAIGAVYLEASQVNGREPETVAEAFS